ncbi:MAG: Uma2 family endonuclease [Leptolyngbyaceae cyanobacterium MAG.088]|nr:Uma2 family endonuclease [Leptolyngbyaceae cyanobacterium MAG.088]
MSDTKLRFQPGNTLPQVDPPRSPRHTLPTMYDLPSEYPEEPGLPDEFHDLQPQLLSRTLYLPHYSRENWFSASDLNVYYDVNHALWHKRPDWFLVVGVPRLYEGNTLRRSYVTWQEGASPYVVVEFLSTGTERGDLGRFYTSQPPTAENATLEPRPDDQPPEKLEMYERFLRVPHYIVYSRHSQKLRYFQLTGGVYEEHPLQSGNCAIWLTDLDVGLGIWQGEFDGVPGHWLRWCDQHGTWCLTDTEQEKQAKEQERQAKEKSQAQLLQAAKNLLATDMSLEQVTELLALTDEQVDHLRDL